MLGSVRNIMWTYNFFNLIRHMGTHLILKLSLNSSYRYLLLFQPKAEKMCYERERMEKQKKRTYY